MSKKKTTNEKSEVVITVRCISCKKTRKLSSLDGPHNDQPMCEDCGMPMIAVKAEAKRIGGKRG